MPCPVCDDRVEDGELCPAHRAMARRNPPVTLVKVTPPKQHDYISVASLAGGLDEPEPERRFEKQCGYAGVEVLSLVVLFVILLVVLYAWEFKW